MIGLPTRTRAGHIVITGLGGPPPPILLDSTVLARHRDCAHILASSVFSPAFQLALLAVLAFWVAKGERKIARQIREIAEEHGIPIVENPPLAQALYKNVEVGEVIPMEFYQAIAEVLAYVHELTNRYSGLSVA